jgi:hypothetical protein
MKSLISREASTSRYYTIHSILGEYTERVFAVCYVGMKFFVGHTSHSGSENPKNEITSHESHEATIM